MDQDKQHYSFSVRDKGDRSYKDRFVATEAEAQTLMVAEAGFMCQHGDYVVADIGSHRIEVESVDDPERGTEFLVRAWPGALA